MLSFKKFDWADEVFEEVEVIESDGVGPRLYITPDNKKLPSMTSVLSLLDDGGIDKWVERDESDC